MVDIETELPRYAGEFYSILHTPGTYARCWRDFKKELYKKHGLKSIIKIGKRGVCDEWKIEWV